MRRLITKKGQSTLEYVIILTAVIASIIFAATKFIKPAVEEGFGDVAESIQHSADELGLE